MINKIQRLKTLRLHIILFGLSIFFIIMTLSLLWWDVARQPYLPNNFSYSADTLATETFYDSNEQPSSVQYLKTNLQLSLDQNATRTALNSSLKRTSVTGEEATSIKQSNPINIQTGRYSDNATNTYVFAPRGATKDQTFNFRYPAYNATAVMHYEGQEAINGLQVYRYSADYSQTPHLAYADTAANLSESQSVEYRPALQIWVEPTTGWLVKYQDDTTTQRVDKTTKKPISIFSRISEKTTEESVRQQIAYAKTQRLKLLFAEQVAPSIILTIILTLLLAIAIMQMKRVVIPIYGATGVVLAASIAVLVGWLINAPLLITLFTSTTGTNPLSAVCFALVSLAIIALYKDKRKVVALAGGVLGVIAGLQLLSTLGSLPSAVDLLFFKDQVLELSQTIPSRMSLYTAFTFFILSIGLVKAGFTTKNTEIHFAKFIAGIVLSLGIFSIIVQFTQVDRAFSLSFVQSLSLASSALFVICGFTLMQLFRTIHAKPDNLTSTLRAAMWPALATVPLIIIGIFAQTQQNTVTQELRASFDEKTSAFAGALNGRVGIFANTLTGTAAFFSASKDVTANEFHNFVSAYDIQKQYPGLENIGFAQVATSQVVTDPGSGGTVMVYPATSRPTRAAITYIEPFSQKQLGYDLLADPAQKEAIERARDTGRTILSNKTALLENETLPTSLLVAPVYKNNADISTISAKQRAVIGYVFGTINTRKLVSSVDDKQLGAIDFSIYDGLEENSETLLYHTPTPTQPYIPRLSEVATTFIAFHPWTFTYSATPDFRLGAQEELSPTIILIGGSLAYFAIVVIAYFLVDLERRSHLARQIKRLKR